MHTGNQSSINERVHSPNIRSPVRMAQSPRKRKQPVFELQQLTPLREWTEGNCKDTNHTHAKLDNVTEPGPENRLNIKAIGAKEVDEVGEGKV